MNNDPLILGFDTSAAYCAAAILRGETVLCAVGEEMARGQAERLMGLLEEVLDAGKVGWSDLDALAVGVGPGNFTGIRIGVSAARGLALGLDVPAYGVSGFAARARLDQPQIIAGPRGKAYVLKEGMPALIDSIAPASPEPAELARAIAAEGAAQWPATALPPAPLYVKPADAAPARDAPPLILP